MDNVSGRKQREENSVLLDERCFLPTNERPTCGRLASVEAQRAFREWNGNEPLWEPAGRPTAQQLDGQSVSSLPTSRSGGRSYRKREDPPGRIRTIRWIESSEDGRKFPDGNPVGNPDGTPTEPLTDPSRKLHTGSSHGTHLGSVR